ncbi:MAG: hypothetical protein NTW13_03490 [Candidatus Omnitrophica bacterium]|nr:hypothetical protein [Candidatus Omnitrophota bacterium]
MAKCPNCGKNVSLICQIKSGFKKPLFGIRNDWKDWNETIICNHCQGELKLANSYIKTACFWVFIMISSYYVILAIEKKYLMINEGSFTYKLIVYLSLIIITLLYYVISWKYFYQFKSVKNGKDKIAKQIK